MLGKWWKKIALIILIIACVINISIKIVNRPSFKNEMQSSAEYFQDLKIYTSFNYTFSINTYFNSNI